MMPRIARFSFQLSLLLLLVLPGTVLAQDDDGLPSEIKYDLYLLEAEKKLKANDPKAAFASYQKVLKLDFTPPAGFYYKYGKLALKISDYQAAKTAFVHYLKAEGRKGTHYLEILRLYSEVREALINQKKVHVAAEEKTKQKADAAKMKATLLPYIKDWNRFVKARKKTQQAVLSVILADRELWNQSAGKVQSLAIVTVSKKLGDNYLLTDIKLYECGGQKHRIATFRHKKTGIRLNLIPGGKVLTSKRNLAKNGLSQSVKIVPAVLVGQFEVTQKQWMKVSSKKNPSRFLGKNNPIEQVSRIDIVAWLGQLDGKLRLPTSIEWEYACRSGTQSKYFWGETMNEFYCWYAKNSQKKSHPMNEQSSRGNAFGLVDMSGNVWEWTTKDGGGISGGSWLRDSEACQSSKRVPFEISGSSYGVGFRVVRSLD